MSETEGVKGCRCPKCNWSDFFETKTCPQCHSELNEALFSNRGKIATFTVIRYPPKGFDEEAPYVVGLVALEHGPRVIGRIKANPEELRTNQSVRYVGRTKGALCFEPEIANRTQKP
jgi:uncharacterized OB-fold protein